MDSEAGEQEIGSAPLTATERAALLGALPSDTAAAAAAAADALNGTDPEVWLLKTRFVCFEGWVPRDVGVGVVSIF